MCMHELVMVSNPASPEPSLIDSKKYGQTDSMVPSWKVLS